MNPLLPPTTPTRNELIELFHVLAADISLWLKSQLLRHGGRNWWQSHVVSVVRSQDQQRITDGEWKELEDLDLGALLNLLQANFRFLIGRKTLNKGDRETIRAMKNVRNRCEGHWPIKGIPRDEFIVHFSAIREFAKLIGAESKLTDLIKSVQQSMLAAESNDVTSTPAEIPTAPPFILNEGKRLAECFEGEELTPSQQDAVSKLQEFLDDPNRQCFILRGYAGTGKTFLIGGLVRYLNEAHRKPQMMAPTGRAAHVLRERHQVEASTIHRHIYSLAALKEYKEIDESGDVTYKFYFELKNNDIEHDTVFIVDEASMLSDVYSESEFMHFGSGRLLSDLLRYINFDSNDYRKKLILVGDDAQLPPVGMNNSPALNREYLRDKCLIQSRECELTDVVRQMESSLVLENATRMRQLLNSGRFPSFDFKVDGELIREFSPDEFVETFVRERDGSTANRSIIVTYTNASTRNYNDAVRSRIFPGFSSLHSGDQIIVVRNNYRYERALLNGQMGLVVECGDQTEHRIVPLNVGVDASGKRKVETIKLEFREATLRFTSESEGPVEVTCLISEDCLLNRDADVSSNYSKALYVDFKARHPHLQPGQPEFKEALKADPYFNAVMLKFGYAITCHKAQGGEWETVFVDFSGRNSLKADDIRWSYTALTRAENAVVATNALHHHVLKPKKAAARVVEIPPQGSAEKEPKSPTIVAVEIEATNEENLPMAPLTSEMVVKQLVESLLPPDWKLASTRSLPYQEQLTLEKGAANVSVSIHFKSNHRISKVQVKSAQGVTEADQLIATALTPLKGQTLRFGLPVPDEVLDTHQPFVTELRNKLKSAGIGAVTIKSLTGFHLEARLRVGMTEGSINYYFDGKGTLSKYVPAANCPGAILEKLQSIHD